MIGSSLAVLLPMLRAREILMAGRLAAAHLVSRADLVAVPFARGELPPRRVQLLSLHGRALPRLAQTCADSIVHAIRGYKAEGAADAMHV